MTTDSNNQIKCRYFDKGYCKLKNSCKYYHPSSDCENRCKDDKCRYRHRRDCKYGDICYHNKRNVCEYAHNNEIPMNVDDKEQNEAHPGSRQSTIR